MTTIRKKFESVRTRYAIELFPFESVYPDSSDFASKPSTIIMSKKDIAAHDEEIEKQKKNASSKEVDSKTTLVAGALSSLRFGRSKSTVDAQCTFTLEDSIDGVVPGTWVLITSSSTDKDGKPRRLVRFIGQIYAVEPSYYVQSNALIVTRITVYVRSWSAALMAPVRYDINSIVNSLPGNTATTAAAGLVHALGAIGQGISYEELSKISIKAYSAYELVHLILKLIGAISQSDQLGAISSLGDVKLPDVALAMPSIPKALLERLGVKANPASAYSSGFVDVITGTQKVGVNNDGTWDGVFGASTGAPAISQAPLPLKAVTPSKPSNNASYSIEDFKNSFDKDPADRPMTLGLASLVSTGQSAWTMINQHCEPSINEFFTDIVYQPVGENDIAAKPVIIARDKPFLLKKLKDESSADLSSFTLYDDLPRVYLDNVYITNFKMSSTFINSPNFIRTNYQSQVLENESAKALSQVYGTERLDPEMRRFGGQEMFTETQFLSKDIIDGRRADVDFKDWFTKIKEIIKSWHSYNYKTPSGTLMLEDDNIPLTVGFNVQFEIGNFTLVGHVESYDLNFQVDQSGNHISTTQVKLSRIVQVIDGKLDYINPDALNNLFSTEPKKSPVKPKAIASLSIISDTINAIKGLF